MNEFIVLMKFGRDDLIIIDVIFRAGLYTHTYIYEEKTILYMGS